MLALLALLSAAFGMVVKTVRDEKKADAARLAAESARTPSQR